jgi:cytochrome c
MSSSLEGNKIAAAVLTAGVIAMTTGLLAHILYGSEKMTENAYLIQVPETSAAGMAGEAAQEEPLAILLASADLAAGEKQAKKCAACHSFDQGGPDKIGPNLWEILDNGIANNAGFAYSDTLAGKTDETWTYDNLSGFLANPRGWAPGTEMSFAGISKASSRADLIFYLRSLSASPAELPVADVKEEAAEVTAEDMEADVAESGEGQDEATQTAEAAAPATAADGGLGALLAAADPEAGKKQAKKCAACHTMDEGGANKIGPNLWNIVNRPIAGAEGYSYSSAMTDMSGESWSFANLDGFLTSPKGWVKGTKMSFAGVRKEGQRADLLAYLRSLSSSPAALPE